MPAPHTLQDVLSLFKELSTIGGIAVVVWRIFIFLHQATNAVNEAAITFKAIPVFMDGTTKSLGMIHDNVNTAVSNHLTHMEDGITKLAENTERLADQMGKHIIDISKTQAVIIDRLPQI